MKSSLNAHERWELIRRIQLAEELEQRQARLAPAEFRRRLRLTDNRGVARRFTELEQPWQKADFAALDPAWQRLARMDAGPGPQRAYLERPRGHSKTSDMAMQLAWILLYGRPGLAGLAAAADSEQAALIRDALQRLALTNPSLCSSLTFFKDSVVNRQTRSRLSIISSDVNSSWGVLPDFVICDELCHWEKPDLWYSLLSSAAKREQCVLAVLTNAGVGRDWQWNVRETARTSPLWHFSSLDGPQAPWIRPAWLDEQRDLLPPPVFERLWLNRWQHSDGEFLTLAEAEACRDNVLTEQSEAVPFRHYIAAIDYAEKRDYTVGVLLHREGNVLVVDRMDVVRPRPDRPTPVRWVADWIERMTLQFQQVTFVLDPYQMIGTIQHYEVTHDIRRFEFGAGVGNHALTLALRKAILHQEVRWYPGCGQIPDAADRDDLETELSSLLLRQTNAGRCRIDHRQDGRHHDDRSFALGAAILHALTDSAPSEWLEIQHPGGRGEW